MILIKSRWMSALCGCVLLSACVSYEAQPLDPGLILDQVDLARHTPLGVQPDISGPVFTLSQAATWMREHGPEVQEAIAAFETAQARASVATPLPNPTVQIGPQWGYGGDIGSADKVVPFGTLGFTIPLGGRLARQDELNQALANQRRVEGLARHRELYLQLRTQYTRLVLGQARKRLRAQIVEATGRTVTIAQRLVNAGAATAIDLALFELESARSSAAELLASQQIVGIEAQLSGMIGVSAELFQNLPAISLPTLPSNTDSLAGLRTLLVDNHTVLGRLRARYEVAERQLRLQVSKQYPDFKFGPNYQGDPGERRYLPGLNLGISIPIFNQNQQAIAQATKQREQVRVRYEAAMNRALARLEGAFRAVELARQRRDILKQRVFPQAETSVRIARKSLSAGSGNAIRLLDAQRSFRQIQVEMLEADLDLREAWSTLEQAVGYPIVQFPSEESVGVVEGPAALTQPSEEASMEKENSK